MMLQLHQSKQTEVEKGFDVTCFRALFVHFKLDTHCLCNKCHSKENVRVGYDCSDISPDEGHCWVRVLSQFRLHF